MSSRPRLCVKEKERRVECRNYRVTARLPCSLFCLARVCRLPSLLSEHKDAMSTRKSRLTMPFARCRRLTPISDRSPSDRQPARFTISFRRCEDLVRERVPDGPGCCSYDPTLSQLRRPSRRRLVSFLVRSSRRFRCVPRPSNRTDAGIGPPYRPAKRSRQ